MTQVDKNLLSEERLPEGLRKIYEQLKQMEETLKEELELQEGWRQDLLKERHPFWNSKEDDAEIKRIKKMIGEVEKAQIGILEGRKIREVRGIELHSQRKNTDDSSGEKGKSLEPLTAGESSKSALRKMKKRLEEMEGVMWQAVEELLNSPQYSPEDFQAHLEKIAFVQKMQKDLKEKEKKIQKEEEFNKHERNAGDNVSEQQRSPESIIFPSIIDGFDHGASLSQDERKRQKEDLGTEDVNARTKQKFPLISAARSAINKIFKKISERVTKSATSSKSLDQSIDELSAAIQQTFVEMRRPYSVQGKEEGKQEGKQEQYSSLGNSSALNSLTDATNLSGGNNSKLTCVLPLKVQKTSAQSGGDSQKRASNSSAKSSIRVRRR